MSESKLKLYIMNKLLSWAMNHEKALEFNAQKWTRVLNSSENIPDFLNGGSSHKILGLKLPKEFGYKMTLDPNNTTILGGMCLLTTVDMKKISKKEITFASIEKFESWFGSWYPRIDQIHDTVGIPPKFCRNLIYTIEDSFFAARLSQYTGFDKNNILSILKNTHRKQGARVLSNYLRCLGYRGKITVIYTSEVEKELTVCLKIWERILGTNFRNCDRDFAKVELMYTGFWLDILDISSSAIIYEPASKMILKGWLKIDDWVREQEYGTSVNQNLGIIGYLPFLTNNGDSSVLGFEEVPNLSNFRTYRVREDELSWYIINLLFSKKIVRNGGPLAIEKNTAEEMIYSDLRQYYDLSQQKDV